jgi:Spy/CpxP family protein refolding chaperone
MKKALIIFGFLITIPCLTFAQSGRSPYAGQEKREIKALSQEDIEGYLTGQGMGYAKAAELNHYPGPKHVLELRKELSLEKEQIDKTNESYNRMHKEAVSIGRKIVEKERLLDHLFRSQRIDKEKLRIITLEIGTLQGELRAVHLRAHLEMRQILTPHQIQRYDELRGYQGAEGEHKRHGHHGGHH